MEFQNDIVFLVIGLICGAVVGVALTTLFNRKNTGPNDLSVAQKLEFEVDRSRLQSELENSKAALEEQKGVSRRREVDLAELNLALFNLNSDKVTLEEKLSNEIKNSAEKLADFNDAQQKMTDAFTAISKRALDANNQSFVNHAEEVLKRFQESAQMDLQQRQDKIAEIVVPVQQTITKVDLHITELERERLNTFATMREQIVNMTNSQQKLSDTTAHLVNVLRNTKTRGRWGEIQLRRVVELAGMNKYCDFSEQFNVTTSDGRQQPDMIINLPAQRTIVIDAKAPMNAFLEAHDSTDDAIRKHHFERHAKSLRNHVGQLSKKSYFVTFDPSPEFVLLFLPSEAIYSAALEHDSGLIEYSAVNNVIIATPSTLIALLKAAAHGWRQEAVTLEVKQVAELGKQLYERLSKMSEYIIKVGDSLDKTVKNYNSMVGSVESRVLTSARRFKDLQAIGGASVDIANLEPIETVSRDFQANELRLVGSQTGDDDSGLPEDPIDMLSGQ